jgi:trimethylamine:corrinoid methyltransferase-like protein
MARMGTRASCANALKLEKAEALAMLVVANLATKSLRVIFKYVP